MKKIFFVFVLLSLVIVTGCASDTTKMTVNDGETQVEIETNVKAGNEWCQKGTTWSATASGEENANMNMVVQGIITEGKYAGYCHVTYDITSDDGQANMDFYYDEDGNGYQVMDINGNTFESSWTKPE